jgi:EAL domain-containing protein (putative c-di-GMP-specific phosphodiesterase class I)/GGDEF domain-containing protein
MIALPAFLMDHPNRTMCLLAFWGALFAVLSALVKQEPYKTYDLIHVIEFFLAGSGVTYLVLRIRLKSLTRLNQLQYLMDHDRDTKCLNRYAFEGKTEEYTGKPITVIMTSLDQVTLYSDFYGEAVAEDILHFVIRTLMDHYGEDMTFRYGEEDILCVVPGFSKEECDRIAAECRKATHGYVREGYRIAVTFSQGRVEGHPDTAEELQSMVHLAHIYSHRAGAQGRDRDWSGTWSQEALNEAAADANVSSQHMKAFEMNPLSGLPTMTYFCMRVDELLTNLVDMEAIPVVGYFKLTMMKEYNDEYGYQAGDKLIIDTSKAVQEAFPYRLVGHITAGQFCFFCYLKEGHSGVQTLLDNIRKKHPEFLIRGKAGLAEYTGKESATELLDLARIAQRSIMKRPDLYCCQYNIDLDEELRFRQYIMNHLDEAIRQEWLQVYYQPIVRADTGHICCEEALSRWNDPQRGFLMPFRFIPPLEEKGLMYKLNLAVVDRVLKDCRRREEMGMPVVPVSVNLSRNDFLQCDMVKEITDRVAKSGYTPDILRIEITESAFVANQEMLGNEVKRFRENGFKVWMDDFGSEYSTLNLLEELDFNLVKIDMKFMRNMAVGEKNHIIVSNAIRMIKELGSGTLMEGVETEEQEKMLQDMGCGLLQGYLFNKPRPFDQIVSEIRSGNGLVYETAGEEKAAP